MMAGSRSLTASTTRNGTTRKRIAAAAGSFVAVSATASAFLVDTKAAGSHAPDGTSSPGGFWNRIDSHGTESAPSMGTWWKESAPWVTSVPTQLWSRMDRADETIDAEADVSAEKATMERAKMLSETLRHRFRVGDSYVWLYRDVEGTPTSWEKYTVTDIEETQAEGEQPEFVATIEMSTKFDADEAYQTHHRIKANLLEHVLESSESKDGWRIGFEFFLSEGSKEGGSWKSFGKGDNVQAFEEKFDIFSMVSAAAAEAARNRLEATAGDETESLVSPWTTMLSSQTAHCENDEIDPTTRPASLAVATSGQATTKEPTKLTQTKRHGYTEAWYGPANHETLSGVALYKEFPHSQHSFSLIERTTTTTSGAKAVTDAIEVVV